MEISKVKENVIKSLRATIEQDKEEIRRREAQIEQYQKHIQEVSAFLTKLEEL